MKLMFVVSKQRLIYTSFPSVWSLTMVHGIFNEDELVPHQDKVLTPLRFFLKIM